jgi:hypothetical protein
VLAAVRFGANGRAMETGMGNNKRSIFHEALNPT